MQATIPIEPSACQGVKILVSAVRYEEIRKAWCLGSEEFRSQQAGSGFEVLFRLYRPQKPLFDKTWVLPDIERVK